MRRFTFSCDQTESNECCSADFSQNKKSFDSYRHGDIKLYPFKKAPQIHTGIYVAIQLNTTTIKAATFAKIKQCMNRNRQIWRDFNQFKPISK